eukprot:g8146.t1
MSNRAPHPQDRGTYTNCDLSELAKAIAADVNPLMAELSNRTAFAWKQLLLHSTKKREAGLGHFMSSSTDGGSSCAPLDSGSVYVLFVTLTKLRGEKRLPDFGAFLRHLCGSVRRHLEGGGVVQQGDPGTSVTTATGRGDSVDRRVLEHEQGPLQDAKQEQSAAEEKGRDEVPALQLDLPRSVAQCDDQYSPRDRIDRSNSDNSYSAISNLTATHLCGICGTFPKLRDRISDPETLDCMRSIVQRTAQAALTDESEAERGRGNVASNDSGARTSGSCLLSGQDLGYLLDACRALDLIRCEQLQTALGFLLKSNWDMLFSGYGLVLVTTGSYFSRRDKLAWKCLAYRLKETLPALPGSSVVKILKHFHSEVCIRDRGMDNIALALFDGGADGEMYEEDGDGREAPLAPSSCGGTNSTLVVSQLSSGDVFDLFVHTRLLHVVEPPAPSGARPPPGMIIDKNIQQQIERVTVNLLATRLPSLLLPDTCDPLALLAALSCVPFDIDPRLGKKACGNLIASIVRNGRICEPSVQRVLARIPEGWKGNWLRRMEALEVDRGAGGRDTAMTSIRGASARRSLTAGQRSLDFMMDDDNLLVQEQDVAVALTTDDATPSGSAPGPAHEDEDDPGWLMYLAEKKLRRGEQPDLDSLQKLLRACSAPAPAQPDPEGTAKKKNMAETGSTVTPATRSRLFCIFLESGHARNTNTKLLELLNGEELQVQNDLILVSQVRSLPARLKELGRLFAITLLQAHAQECWPSSMEGLSAHTLNDLDFVTKIENVDVQLPAPCRLSPSLNGAQNAHTVGLDDVELSALKKIEREVRKSLIKIIGADNFVGNLKHFPKVEQKQELLHQLQQPALPVPPNLIRTCLLTLTIEFEYLHAHGGLG